ncbi:MAG: alpha/beta fold hydrolase [Deltaproteobacteria bacterium]|nr:alpha/beta fold hydrolase [Deltaproteobacteria bacterium]
MFDNIILIHGLSGNAKDMDYIAGRIAGRGCMVSNINLPGHGTARDGFGPESLLSVKMSDWIEAVEKEVGSSKDNVAIVGQSMGALLAIYSAVKHPDRIKGVVLLSPAIKLYGRLNRLSVSLIYIWSTVMGLPTLYYTKGNGPDIADADVKKGYTAYNKIPLNALAEYERLRRLVVGMLGGLKSPLLIVYSGNDHTISQDAVEIIDSKVISTVKRIRSVNDSFHVISIDRDRENVAEEIDRFLRYIETEV